MRTPSRRLLVLLCVAVLGVLVALALLAAAVAGPAGLVVFALLAGVLVVLGVRRGRALLAPPPLPPGRTCTCCTTSQFDPVEVV